MIQRDSIAIFCAALILLASPSPSLANDQICGKLGDLAEKVMTLRQQDKPMSLVMSEVAGKVTNEAMNKVVRTMIVEAYKKPSWGTAENKTRASAEFRNDNEVLCFEAFAD